jgi:hypothetical protein
MSEDDVINDIKALRTKFQNIDNFDGAISNALHTLFTQLENYESIDKEVVTTLKNHLGNELIAKDSYKDMIDAITQGSTIVYFKSAQLFKVYSKDELYTLLSGHLRTIYKNLSNSFEIVPNESKQKIIIMGEHSLIRDIDNIKTHISKFMLAKGIDGFKEDDIVCFKNNTMLEIIINNYYVSNSTERDAVVKDLLQYIFQTDKNTSIVSKLGRATFSDFTGSDMIPMPSDKQLLNANFVEYIDGLVGNIEKCAKIDKSGNTYIINLNMQNATINNQSTIHINQPDENEEIDNCICEFVEYIIENKPNWYTPNKWILIGVLYTQFVKLYDEIITIKQFSVHACNKLFVRRTQKVVNGKKGRAVLLFTYDSLAK